MNPVYIYALINPIDNEIFYIGVTNNLKNRVSLHATQMYILKDKKSKTLCHIIEEGQKADIVVLDEYCGGNDFEIRKLEEFYIKLFKDYGFNINQNPKSYYCSNRKVPQYTL